MAAPEVDTCSERAGRPAPLPLNYCQSYNNNRITMEFFPILGVLGNVLEHGISITMCIER